MSGIAGLALRGRRLPDPAVVAALGRALAHRGLACGAAFAGPGIALLGAASSAPASAGSAVMVASHLPAGPAAARSEPPLASYRRQGLDFAAALPGPHALAVQDHAMRRLVLVRDGFGLAPLYVAETSAGLAFASEAQALLRTGLVAPRLRATARDELLQMQFTTGGETVFEGILRLRPGEVLAVADGAVVERRHHPALPEGGPEPIDEPAALARFEAAFLASTARVLDGRVGLLLPGGVNGAAVLTALRRLGMADIPALMALPEGRWSGEGRAAEALALAGGARPVPVPVDAGAVWRALPALAAAMDDPVADPGALVHWLLAEAAQGEVEALLSGEGADELLAGHGRHRAARRPWWLWGRAMRARGTFDRLQVLRAEPRAWRDGIAAAEAEAAQGGRSRLQAAQALDAADWLPHGVLAGLERSLARHGLMARAPFLDPAVARACFRLPDALKVRGREGKWLLRRWVAHGPHGVAPGRGVRLPLGPWIAKAAGRLGPLVAAQPGVAELCRPGQVEALFRRAAERRAGQGAWALLFYALWHRVHIEGRPAEGDVFALLG